MEMHQIRYFLAAAETLNFTRAAERCHVTQPALTHAIKKLEDELGALLFHREGRGLVLTEFGTLIRPHFQRTKAEADATADFAKSFRLLEKAPLSIGAMPTIGSVRFSPFLSHFQRIFPGVEIAIREGLRPELLQGLERETLDIAVMCSADGFGDMLRATPLYRERYVVLFPPDHDYKARDVIRLADLDGQPYVDRLSCEMREMVNETLGERGITLYARFRSEREDWVQSMVAADIGFAFVPEFSVTLPGLVVRPLVEPTLERTVALVTVPGRRHSPAAEAFVTAARRYNWP